MAQNWMQAPLADPPRLRLPAQADLSRRLVRPGSQSALAKKYSLVFPSSLFIIKLPYHTIVLYCTIILNYFCNRCFKMPPANRASRHLDLFPRRDMLGSA